MRAFQIITWLGVILNTIDGNIKASDERIPKLNAGLVHLSSGPPPRKVHAKNVANVTGQIISLSSCVGPAVVRIITKLGPQFFSFRCFSFRNHFLESLSEIIFWKKNVVPLKPNGYWSPHSLPVKVTYSDASNSACGAFVENANLVFHQNWSPEESAQSFTWREPKAVSLAVEAFANHFSGFKVIWYADNQNVECIIR